ncbi:MAG: transposase [Opitutales bacterium]|nr:transposase [Opitutales bacterium]
MSYHLRIKTEHRAAFHCVCRVTRQLGLLGEPERDALAAAMRRAAAFSGVELLAYCVLSNHFHLLVRVDPQARECGDEELLKRFRALYGEERAQCLGMDAKDLETLFADPARAETAEKVRAKLFARMGDVSAFMQTLKQRYTKWFNRTHSGDGTLWSERFRSVLVQDASGPLRTVAAYIDLNAVRAGLVDDPKNYRWCGYAAALAGDEELRRAYGGFFPQAKEANAALADYRIYLLGKGRLPKRDGTGARVPERVAAEARASSNRLPAHELLLRKTRHFSEGLVLGTKAFVEAALRGREGLRYRRKRAPKPVPSPAEEEALACARQWLRAKQSDSR